MGSASEVLDHVRKALGVHPYENSVMRKDPTYLSTLQHDYGAGEVARAIAFIENEERFYKQLCASRQEYVNAQTLRHFLHEGGLTDERS